MYAQGMSWWWWVFVSLLSGCATHGYRMPDGDDTFSRAPAAAYGADGMNFRKDMPHSSDVKPWEFYYKHCAVNGNEAFYSKTSYDCSGPAF